MNASPSSGATPVSSGPPNHEHVPSNLTSTTIAGGYPPTRVNAIASHRSSKCKLYMSTSACESTKQVSSKTAGSSVLFRKYRSFLNLGPRLTNFADSAMDRARLEASSSFETYRHSVPIGLVVGSYALK